MSTINKNRVADASSITESARAGLHTALLLREQFPAFFLRYLADESVCPELYFGVQHAFLELANRHLIRLCLDDINLALQDFDPDGIFCVNDADDATDEETAEIMHSYYDLGLITEATMALHPWVVSPPLLAYGLEIEAADPDNDNEGILALALWVLGSATRWSRGPRERKRGSKEMNLGMLDLVTDPVWQQRLRAIPVLPADTRMKEVCRDAAWNCALPGIEPGWNLGRVVAFVFGKTGNDFADNISEELAQAEVPDLFETPRLLAELGKMQAEARYLRQVYQSLDRRVRQQPELLNTIVRVLLQVDPTPSVQLLRGW